MKLLKIYVSILAYSIITACSGGSDTKNSVEKEKTITPTNTESASNTESRSKNEYPRSFTGKLSTYKFDDPIYGSSGYKPFRNYFFDINESNNLIGCEESVDSSHFNLVLKNSLNTNEPIDVKILFEKAYFRENPINTKYKFENKNVSLDGIWGSKKYDFLHENSKGINRPNCELNIARNGNYISGNLDCEQIWQAPAYSEASHKFYLDFACDVIKIAH